MGPDIDVFAVAAKNCSYLGQPRRLTSQGSGLRHHIETGGKRFRTCCWLNWILAATISAMDRTFSRAQLLLKFVRYWFDSTEVAEVLQCYRRWSRRHWQRPQHTATACRRRRYFRGASFHAPMDVIILELTKLTGARTPRETAVARSTGWEVGKTSLLFSNRGTDSGIIALWNRRTDIS